MQYAYQRQSAKGVYINSILVITVSVQENPAHVK